MSDLPVSKELLQLLQSTGESCLHFECETAQSEELFRLLQLSHTALGAVLRGEGYYKNLTAEEYLRLFAGLAGKRGITPAVQAMKLADLVHIPMAQLSAGEKKRTAIARELLKEPAVLFVEEPLQNMEEESAQILLEWMEGLPKGLQLITASASTKNVFLLPGPSFYFSGEELRPLEPAPSAADPGKEIVVEKIAARQGEKVLLFNPGEVDYIESSGGCSWLNVRGSAFASQLTMEELEGKLRQYGFYRSHRSYLVNMQKVREVVRWTKNSYSLRLEGREAVDIPLSKGRIEEIKELYHF